MSGVVGIIDTKDVGLRLYYSLMAIQHRGQDAAGILTNKDLEFYLKKDKGLVKSIFTDADLSTLLGNVGIGQTRYSTMGKASNTNTQPMYVNSKHKIAMVHDGNILNYEFLKSYLYEKNCFLTTNLDLEPLLNVFAIEYQKSNNYFESVKKVMEIVKGAYSVIGIISEKGIFAFRDSNGFRPLCLGKKEGSYAIASESAVFQTIGYEFVRDIMPGEAIFIDSKTFEIESKIIKKNEVSHCMFEWVYFAKTNSMLEERAVYSARLALGSLISEKLKDEAIDVVIPVPDTGRTAAVRIAECMGVKYREGLIKNRYIDRTFIMPTQNLRTNNINLKLDVIISVVKDKNVAVVDDSIVRGTTSKKIVKLLKDAGAKKIIFISTSPPIKHPCFYGVDMSNPSEFIANRKSIEDIKKYLGVDKLVYADSEFLKEAIKRDLCMACINGNYPIEITDKEKDFFLKEK